MVHGHFLLNMFGIVSTEKWKHSDMSLHFYDKLKLPFGELNKTKFLLLRVLLTRSIRNESNI